MSYFSEAKRNFQKITDVYNYCSDAKRKEMIRKQLGKYLGTIDDLVDYLALENSGLIDTTFRVPVDKVIRFSLFKYPFQTFAQVIAGIMSEIEGKEYDFFPVINTQTVPDEYGEREIDYLNIYILPKKEGNDIISSLESIQSEPMSVYGSAAQAKKKRIAEYLINAFECLKKQTKAVSVPHLLCYTSQFRLLGDINKMNHKLCWKHCLRSVCSIPYLKEFLNLFVFTQYQKGRALELVEIKLLAEDFANSYKKEKSAPSGGHEIKFKPIRLPLKK